MSWAAHNCGSALQFMLRKGVVRFVAVEAKRLLKDVVFGSVEWEVKATIVRSLDCICLENSACVMSWMCFAVVSVVRLASARDSWCLSIA